MSLDQLQSIPEDLPRPLDDGAADHLPGILLSPIELPATDGSTVVLTNLPGRTVVYCYPRTGRPGQPGPDGWDAIPGARGCTPQSCSFRDSNAEFAVLGVRVFGLSTQDTDYQAEAAARLHLPFCLLSDHRLELTRALELPIFEVEGETLLRRLTLVIEDGRIEKVFYPVFPPGESAATVLDWLRANPST